MLPTRRTLLRVAGTTTLAGAAGCLGTLRSGSVAVRVDNRDDRRHAGSVAFLSDGDSAAEERFEVAAGTEREYRNVVAAGEYTVDVALDGGPETRVAFTMQGCTDNVLFVAVDADAELEAGTLDEC
jgi:hypothetical protein